jgi:hypothetical protein
MRLTLAAHPDFPGAAVRAIEVDIERPLPTRLTLTYRVTADPDCLVLPAPMAGGGRADELWRTTCFELFIRPEPGEAYFEFNIAPSLQWAAYRFDSYRAGMAQLDVDAPAIGPTRLAHGCELPATLMLPPVAGARFAPTAIIEETGGAKSYWALAHAPGRPDFHSFTGIPLPPPEAAS